MTIRSTIRSPIRSTITSTLSTGGVDLLDPVADFAGTIHLPGRPGSVFQETTGASATTPADEDGESVGSLKNLGTRGGWKIAPSSPARPTLKLVSDKWLVRFDGSDDFLYDADPYLWAAGSATWFVALNASAQVSGNPFLLSESNSTDDAPIYCPGFRLKNSDPARTVFIRDNAVGIIVAIQDIDGTYTGGPRVIGIVDTGSQLIPYSGKTAGTPLNYTRSGTLTPNRNVLGALSRTTPAGWVAADVYGVVAMGGVATTQQISNIVDLLSQEAGI